MLETTTESPLHLFQGDRTHGIYVYSGNCPAVLDTIAAKHKEGMFDMIFADPPYFLSNGGITFRCGHHRRGREESPPQVRGNRVGCISPEQDNEPIVS